MKEKKLAQYMVSFGFSYRVNFLLAPLNLAKSQFLYKISYLCRFSLILLQGGLSQWPPQNLAMSR